MAKGGRFRRGQVVYLRYHQSHLLAGLMDNPDGQLVFDEMRPAESRFGRPQCRLRLPEGQPFRTGAAYIDVPSNLVVVVPRADQIAEERERTGVGGGGR